MSEKCETCKHDIDQHDLDEAGWAYCYLCYDADMAGAVACRFPEQGVSS